MSGRRKFGPVVDRFWARVDRSGECWIVPAGGRYGAVVVNRHSMQAHRFSYTIHYGKIPAGLEVCHRCDNTRCVRPGHLFLGTHVDNMRDMAAKGRGRSGHKPHLACPKGHPLAGANLYVSPRGLRQCKACRAARSAAYKERHSVPAWRNGTGWCRRGLHPMNEATRCAACDLERHRNYRRARAAL